MSIKVIFTVGAQASGKSSWAEQFVRDNQDYKRVNRDDLRSMVSGYTFDDVNEKLITVIERNIIKEYIEQGFNIIIDKMNLNQKYVEDDKDFINSLDTGGQEIEYEFKYFYCSLKEAIKRDKNRHFSLGAGVLSKTYHRYEIELRKIKEMLTPVAPIDHSLPYVIICDIDGTMAKAVDRRIFDETRVREDKVVQQVKDLISALQAKYPNYHVMFFSGRKDTCKKDTELWLADNDIYYHSLFMRADGDNRSDHLVKYELYEKYIKGKYNVYCVIDDRKQVCQMWAKTIGAFLFDVSQDPYAENEF